MTYKAIIFDFFDVIHRDPFNYWLRQSGFERSDGFEASSNLLDLGEIDHAEFYRQLGEASGQPPEQVEAAFADTTLIDHDMLALIGKLKLNYKIGLLSNTSIAYIWDIIKEHDIESLFDVITVSAEIKLMKPDPKIFRHILKKLEAKPAETIFIDDNPKNVTAAEALGIKSLTYTNVTTLTSTLSDLGIAL